MNLIKRWNEYLGPKDERLEAEASRCLRASYYLLLAGVVVCLYYALMIDQVSSTTDTPVLTPVGARVFPATSALIVVVLAACFIPLVLQVRRGILSDRSRYAQVERVPWDLVLLTSLFTGLAMGVLSAGMRMLAEVQIVGVAEVTWAGDVAMGVVYFVMGFLLALVATVGIFRSAIRNRRRLEDELDD